MSIKIKAGTEMKTVRRLRLKVGGVLRPIKRARVMIGGILKTVFLDEVAASLTVSILPATQFTISVSQAITSNPVTATPTGGTAPYIYVWSVPSFTGIEAPIVNAQGNATSTFTQHGVEFNSTDIATVRCTVTDANGLTGFDEADISFINISNFGSFFL